MVYYTLIYTLFSPLHNTGLFILIENVTLSGRKILPNITNITYICLPKSGSFSTLKSLTLGSETDPMLRQHKLKIK